MTGLYRDRNLGEPALAAMIQEDIGANPEDPYPGAHGTFSFDIANGVCGPLTALQVADGFLRSGAIHRALVVTSDANPGHGMSDGFPFASAGGALLCRWTEDESGFGPFSWANFPDGGESFQATVSMQDGKNRLRIVASDAHGRGVRSRRREGGRRVPRQGVDRSRRRRPRPGRPGASRLLRCPGIAPRPCAGSASSPHRTTRCTRVRSSPRCTSAITDARLRPGQHRPSRRGRRRRDGGSRALPSARRQLRRFANPLGSGRCALTRGAAARNS